MMRWDLKFFFKIRASDSFPGIIGHNVATTDYIEYVHIFKLYFSTFFTTFQQQTRSSLDGERVEQHVLGAHGLISQYGRIECMEELKWMDK